jgi:ketosteroid isomerase-like protein
MIRFPTKPQARLAHPGRGALIAISLLAMLLLAAGGSGRGPAGQAPGTGPGAEAAIRGVLEAQASAWNRGDLEGFLEGYWKSNATAFAGTQGILRGWQALRERYRGSYPNRAAMGTLRFSDLEITPLCADAALVLGHWHLDRATGPVGGVFSLVLRQFPEGWRIVADHTSATPPPAPESR